MGQAIDFKGGSGVIEDLPVVRFAKLILWQAIQDKADQVIFELEPEAHKAIQAEKELLTAARIFDSTRFPSAFRITYKIGDVGNELTPTKAVLFEPAMRVLLNAAEIPFWKKGDISAELVTANPDSKWLLESKDLTRRIELRRIREQ